MVAEIIILGDSLDFDTMLETLSAIEEILVDGCSNLALLTIPLEIFLKVSVDPPQIELLPLILIWIL